MRSLGPTEGIPVSDELKEQLVRDWRTAPISEFNKHLLDYTERLTREPAKIDKAYIDTLREAGFDDQMLHDAVQVIAYFNYVNRLADGLGVELEEGLS